MPHRLALTALLFVCACGGGSEEPLGVPDTGTPWVIFGTAQSGRAVVPSSVFIKRTTEVLELRPEPIGGGLVDMFFAGLDPRDLPDGIDPSMLVFVSMNDDRAHRLPPLYEPYIFDKPREPDQNFSLIPVENTNATIADMHAKRLETMLRGLAIQDPCTEPTSPISVIVPRTQGEDIPVMRTLSNGDTWVGFTATSTLIAGVIRPGETDLSEVVPIGTGTAAVIREEKVRISDLGDGEIVGPGGRLYPTPFSLNFLGAFGGIGHVVKVDGTKGFVDSIPASFDAAIALLRGDRRVMLAGEASRCSFGSLLGAGAAAGILCHTETSTVWQTSGRFRDALTFIGMIAPDVAFDVSGAVYVYGNGRWEPMLKPAINEGCSPPCAALDSFAVGPPNSGILAVLAGGKAQVFVLLRDSGGAIEVKTIQAFTGKLFGDERREGAHPFITTAITIDPNGALWLAGSEKVLFRVTPDRSGVTRICLPSDAHSAVVTALEAHPDGRLILGMSPATFGFGRWDQ